MWTKSVDEKSQPQEGGLYYHCALSGHIVKITCKYLCCYYTHRSVVLSALVREASFCSGHWVMQRLITCRSAKNSCLLSAHPKTVFLHCFLRGPRNIVGEGNGKNTKAQRQRRVPCNTVTRHDHGNSDSLAAVAAFTKAEYD